MFDWISPFFSEAGFMPHSHCYLARPSLVWTMFVTDMLIGTAYVAISLTLWALVRKIKIQFSAVVLCFGLFIGACGATHFMEVWTLWYPNYWLSAWVKVITAIASVGTGIYIFRLRHPLAAMAEAAKVAEQRRLELEDLTLTLESRVHDRTTALEAANLQLSQEAQIRQEAVAQLHLISDALPSLISFIDRDLRYQFVNPAYEKWFEIPRSKILDHTMTEVLGEEAVEALRPDIESALSGKQTHFERRLTYKTGGTRWIEGTYIPRYSSTEDVLGFAVLINDITDRKLSENALKASEERFRTVTDNAASCLFVLDERGHPTFMNPAAMRVTGYSSLEAIKDKPLHYAIHWKKPDGSHYPLEECPIDNARSVMRPAQNQEDYFCNKDGTLFPVSYSVASLERDGKTVGAVLEFRDITEQKRAEGELRLAIQSRDEFLSIASHELKTPLTSLKLQTQLRQRVLAKGDSSAFSAERLSTLFKGDARQIERLSRLIDDMLDISRISTGKLNLQPEPVDLCDIVKETLDRYRAQFDEVKVTLDVDICEGVIGSWDRYRIEQVVANLLMNALKYGEGKPVHVSVSRSGQMARITVKDQGIGIAKENHSRIFNRFERAISANEISGLGLGLYIVRQIVEMHQGQIWVESELGKGSVFIVELPVERSGDITV